MFWTYLHKCICFSVYSILAAELTSAIDYNIDPCDNFYDFACGMWIKRHVIPEDRSNLYTYGVLRDKVSITVKCELWRSLEI